jgi:putative protease
MVFNVPGDPVAEVTAAFREIVDTLAEGRSPSLERIRSVTGGEFTRGHFARAV